MLKIGRVISQATVPWLCLKHVHVKVSWLGTTRSTLVGKSKSQVQVATVLEALNCSKHASERKVQS